MLRKESEPRRRRGGTWDATTYPTPIVDRANRRGFITLSVVGCEGTSQAHRCVETIVIGTDIFYFPWSFTSVIEPIIYDIFHG